MKRHVGIALLVATTVLPCMAQDGQEITIELPLPPPAMGKPKPPAKVVCWLPAGCKYVRGVIVAHPMIERFATDPMARKMAVEEDLGMMVLPALARSGKESIERLDKVFEEWARKSGRPELRGAAVLTAGLSASVLWARNVGYGAPDRVFGILHVAGGNLHHEMNDERKTLAGVPFIAMNGQLESCGPEGGIRPYLGLETQWYLMGDTMLQRRKEDANNLMSLVVVPCKGHTAWNVELAVLFARKAAQYRLPKEKRDGSAPARCVAIRFEDGWLSDRDVKHPRHEPAPYNEYKGDRSQAFWHFDKEMALAVDKYHRDGIRPGQERGLFRPAGLLEELWPLGERMDIPFGGDTPAEYATVLREWIVRRTGKKLLTDEVGLLAQGIAAGLKKNTDGTAVDEGVCRTVCQQVCHAYEDKFQPIAAAIGKADLPADSKALLRAHYGELMLLSWPRGRQTPDLPVRAVEALVAAVPAGAGPDAVKARLTDAAARRAAMEVAYGAGAAYRPADTDKPLANLSNRDAQAGWAAAGELAKRGVGAIPELVRAMEYGQPPASFRAAAALGQMGAAGATALPDLRRNSARGGATEWEAMVGVKALEAIELIEKAKGEAK